MGGGASPQASRNLVLKSLTCVSLDKLPAERGTVSSEYQVTNRLSALGLQTGLC